MNSVNLTGRLTRDPDVRYTDGGATIARFTVACDRRFKQDGGPTADFISCVSFGKAAEFVEKYFHKGMKMEVSGRIQTGSYTNKDGDKIYTTDVIAEQVGFAESKNVDSNHSSEQENYGPKDEDGFINVPEGIDEELPFS